MTIVPTHEGAQDDGAHELSWGEPKPITAPLLPVMPFDANALLPGVLQDWVIDEAERMPCPQDFIAAMAIVTLGSIVGARCAIKPKAKDDWLIVPNLWGGVVAPPSAKKSPAMSAALRPLDRLIKKCMQEHQTESERHKVDQLVHAAQKDEIERKIKDAAKGKKEPDSLSAYKEERLALELAAPPMPVLRRYKTNDTTVEKLGELLRDNPQGLMILRDELVGLISSWDRDGREGDRAFFLESWNGNSSFDTDRISRGSIFIKNLCTSIFGGIQPDKLTAYLEQAAHSLGNDGMLQRFQVLVFPDSKPWVWRDCAPNIEARNAVFRLFDELAEFDPIAWGASPASDVCKFPHFRFDDEAQSIFIDWSKKLHYRLNEEEHPIIIQHLAKYDKLFPALALILHLVDCSAKGIRGPVTGTAALRAAAWCEYLESHARRCYGLLMDDGLRAAQALAEKLRQRQLENGFTARDVRRNQWRSLTTDQSVQAALDWLEDEGWLRSYAREHENGRGRPTIRYEINPNIKSCVP